MIIKEIAVQGYQSLYKIRLELGQFTVVYGESDVGKSALYRAVRALVTSESGDSFISKGENKVGVALRLSSGDKIIWVKRRGKSCEYRFNEKVWKRNRALPLEVAKVLKLTQLVVDGDKFYPNFRGQFDNLFLLFESSFKRARVLGTLISNILLRAVRQANLKRNRNEADVRALMELIETLERKEKFDWGKFLLNAKATRFVLNRVKKGLDVYGQLTKLRDKWEQYDTASKFSVKKFPENLFTEVEKLIEKHHKLRLLCSSYEVCTDEIRENSNFIGHSQDLLETYEGEMGELKKKLMVRCPHCKKEFSVLEVKNV